MQEIVEIFTDGACKGNPGPGGWAAIVRTRDSEYALSYGERDTTNQRKELTAALNALEFLKEPCHVKLYSDSEYLIKGMNEWIHGWVRNGWRNARKQESAASWCLLSTWHSENLDGLHLPLALAKIMTGPSY